MSARILMCLSGTLLGILAATAPIAAAQESTPGGQWLTVNNRLDGQRFSPLKQITPANAAQLGEVCRVQIDGPTTFHAGLVVADGVIYTDTGLETVAIDATSCAVRWKYTYEPDEDRYSPSNRGLALMDGRIFRGTGDARLIALDAATGRLLWKDVIGTPRLGESASAAPLAWNGVVYMGIAGSELGARGRVMAYDAQTGRELWRFNTIPIGNEVGADTWKRAKTAKTGGGGVWGSMTLDVTTGELFVPVGNPWPDIDKDYRPGTNLFTDSIVVLDARTGALKWWHQTASEDWQDLDLVAAPVLYRDSQIRDVVAFGGKDGYVTAVDRDSHEVLFRTPVTTMTPLPERATPQGIRACPGYAGGVEWNGPTLDRLNNTLVTGSVDACFEVKLGTTKYSADEANFGGTVAPVGPVTGWVTALDSETGKIRWRYHAEKPVIAGIAPTAGGVTFTGDLAGNLLVFDSKSGALLKKAPTGGALAGGVVTYDVGGRQYVAFASGNVSRTAFGALGVPSVVIMALGGSRGAGAAHGRQAEGAAGAGAGAGAGAANIANGRKLYNQVCVSCHGPDGNMIADHKLSNLKARLDRAATIRFIKDPKAPMPKLYPDLLSEQNVTDVATFVHDELGP
ncbi:MAG TPA: PQQ-binding-like beta-propeller repeat protein [Steroidobacteraceae bacterium]|nr:PQQ-binding-like beta-propeller repeat protein [Steroidobacteraceae bacterium]